MISRNNGCPKLALVGVGASDTGRSEEVLHHRLVPGRGMSRVFMEEIASSRYLLMVELQEELQVYPGVYKSALVFIGAVHRVDVLP